MGLVMDHASASTAPASRLDVQSRVCKSLWLSKACDRPWAAARVARRPLEKFSPQGVLPAEPDRAFHQLRMAQLNLYLDAVSRKPEAFVKAVERRRRDQGPLNADGVKALSIRGLLAADEGESTE